MTARVPTKVVLYDYASGSQRPAAEFHWSEEDGVTLQIIEPDWGKLAQRYFTEGVYLSAEQRVVLPSDGEAFMRALVQPTRSTYSALVDESGPSVASMPVAADTGGFTPDEAYRHLAGMPIRPGPDEPPPPEPEVAPLPARTRDEAQLFMDLHPCERCGSVRRRSR